MIIVKITGGLGTQLFGFAYGKVLAKRNNTELWCDLSEYKVSNPYRQLELRRLFRGQIKHSAKVNVLKHIRKVKEKQFHFEQRLYDVKDYHYVTGYFQSYKYFDNIKNEMKDIFKSDHFDYVRGKVEETECETAIHIRHGDFLINPLYYVLPLTYYNNAIDKLDSKKFVVFSDDMEYANTFKNKIKDAGFDCKVWEPIDSIHDMAAMSFFPNIIAANSTFSWWSAYCSNAKVIVPMQYFANNINTDLKDFYPVEWTQI